MFQALLWRAICFISKTQPRICFHIAASPTESFYSQIAMFRLSLDALGGIYEQAHIIISFGDEKIQSIPDKWTAQFGNKVNFHWADPELFRQHQYLAQVDARWNYDHDQYDYVIFCDADIILINPIDDLLFRQWQCPSIMGVIAHYPFLLIPEDDYRQIWAGLVETYSGKTVEFKYHHTLVQGHDLSKSSKCPFYINFGFVLMTPKIVKTIRNTYLTIRPEVSRLLNGTYVSGQIALTLSLLAHDVPARSIGMRYNFPNDIIAESMHPLELADVRVIHYLRTNIFDRQKIFTSQNLFDEFLLLNLDGSNKVFQKKIHSLTHGLYPFK